MKQEKNYFVKIIDRQKEQEVKSKSQDHPLLRNSAVNEQQTKKECGGDGGEIHRHAFIPYASHGVYTL